MGCINKRKENMQMSAGGGLPHGSGEAANSPIVKEKLEQMFASGMMPRETLDYRYVLVASLLARLWVGVHECLCLNKLCL